jgi:glucose-6-phosphate 1-dehydrogenase
VRPYERLLYAGLTGDRQLFAREDSIEQTWRIVQPLLDEPGEIHLYEPGSWGPEAGQSLLRVHRSWQEPWLPSSTHAEQ